MNKKFNDIFSEMLSKSREYLAEIAAGGLDFNKIWFDILGSYKGSDIYEVVCREALVILVGDVQNNKIEMPSEIAMKMIYMISVLETSLKYRVCEDWPLEQRVRLDDIELQLR